MELNDTARVRQPRDAVEYRLATVADLFDYGSTTYIQRYQLRFPNGEERMYRPEAVIACTRDDDRAALVAAFTDACRSLRDACRIAHDHDGDLSAVTVYLMTTLVAAADTHLGVVLDPAAIPAPATSERDEGA